MPFMSAMTREEPTSASTSGSLYEMAVNRWCSTNASASGPANSCSPARNTRSHGTNMSSKTVVVSIILCRPLMGSSAGELCGPCESNAEASSTSPGVFIGTAKLTA